MTQLIYLGLYFSFVFNFMLRRFGYHMNWHVHNILIILPDHTPVKAEEAIKLQVQILQYWTNCGQEYKLSHFQKGN